MVYFCEYVFIKKLRNSKNIIVENQNILEDIKTNTEPVIFISVTLIILS